MHTAIVQQTKNDALTAMDLENIKKNSSKMKKSMKILQVNINANSMEVMKIKTMLKMYLERTNFSIIKQEEQDSPLKLNPSYSQLASLKNESSKEGENDNKFKKKNIELKEINTERTPTGKKEINVGQRELYVKGKDKKTMSQNIVTQKGSKKEL